MLCERSRERREGVRWWWGRSVSYCRKALNAKISATKTWRMERKEQWGQETKTQKTDNDGHVNGQANSRSEARKNQMMIRMEKITSESTVNLPSAADTEKFKTVSRVGKVQKLETWEQR